VLYVLSFGIAVVVLLFTGNASAVKAAQLTAALGAIISIYFSKVYLFLTPRKTYGKIIYLNVEVANQRYHSGIGFPETYRTYPVPELTIEIETDNHKIIRKTLPYSGSNLKLGIGDKIVLMRPSDFPVRIDEK
jgi:hypothetical protein